MEKIGLVTFSNTYDNYGQVFQALATQEYLRHRGHDVFLLRKKETLFTKAVEFSKIAVKALLWAFTRSPQHKQSLETWTEKIRFQRSQCKEERLHPRRFEEFRQQYFNVIDNTDFELRNKGVTTLCTGSDQIWGSPDPFYHLAFGDDTLKRIAIAPSTGNKQLSAKGKKIVVQWLKHYAFITVRENSGVKLCQDLGYQEVKEVLDPTFLVSADVYRKFSPKVNGHENEDYIFVYLLNAPCPVSYEEILSFAKANGLEVKYVTGQGRKDNYEKIYATVPEWIGLMDGAKYVITNSFHGMAMSIIFRKQFLVLPRSGKTEKMNERIIGLAAKMNLTERIYKKDISEVLSLTDYSNAEIVMINNSVELGDLMAKENL